MVCYAEINKITKPTEGISGLMPFCVATSVGFSCWSDKMRTIPLTQNQVALVNDEDYEWLNQWKWCASKLHYGGFAAVRGATGTNKRLFMHRVIMYAPKNMQVDHENHNTLDNRRINLRLATASQSQHNTKGHKNTLSRHKGVTWNRRSRKWSVQIRLNNKPYYGGCFDEEIEAAKAYDNKAKELHGEFACLNFKEIS